MAEYYTAMLQISDEAPQRRHLVRKSDMKMYGNMVVCGWTFHGMIEPLNDAEEIDCPSCNLVFKFELMKRLSGEL